MTIKGHCESSLGSFDECSAAHKRSSTLRPSHLILIYHWPLQLRQLIHFTSYSGYAAAFTSRLCRHLINNRSNFRTYNLQSTK